MELKSLLRHDSDKTTHLQHFNKHLKVHRRDYEAAKIYRKKKPRNRSKQRPLKSSIKITCFSGISLTIWNLSNESPRRQRMTHDKQFDWEH